MTFKDGLWLWWHYSKSMRIVRFIGAFLSLVVVLVIAVPPYIICKLWKEVWNGKQKT